MKNWSSHPVILPLLIALPGLVFLMGLGIYGFPANAWQILALEIVAIVVVSRRIPLGLATYLTLALIAVLFFLGLSLRLSRHTLILFPASILIYHIYLIKKQSLPKAGQFKLVKSDVFIPLGIALWPLLFLQMEAGLSSRTQIFLPFYFFVSLIWKVLINWLSVGTRLAGEDAAVALLILLSLGLGAIPLLSPFGASFYGASLGWMGGASLLVFLRLTFSQNR